MMTAISFIGFSVFQEINFKILGKQSNNYKKLICCVQYKILKNILKMKYSSKNLPFIRYNMCSWKLTTALQYKYEQQTSFKVVDSCRNFCKVPI